MCFISSVYIYTYYHCRILRFKSIRALTPSPLHSYSQHQINRIYTYEICKQPIFDRHDSYLHFYIIANSSFVLWQYTVWNRTPLEKNIRQEIGTWWKWCNNLMYPLHFQVRYLLFFPQCLVSTLDLTHVVTYYISVS